MRKQRFHQPNACKIRFDRTITEYGTKARCIADICGVSRATAARWLKGTSTPPYAACKLLELTLNGRIVPDNWPNYIQFAGDYILTGTARLNHAELSATTWLIGNYYRIMHLIPVIRGEIDELKGMLSSAEAARLELYRQRLDELINEEQPEPPSEPAQPKLLHRADGC